MPPLRSSFLVDCLCLLLALTLAACFFCGQAATGEETVPGEKTVPIYRCGKVEEKKIALTFDDGPHPTLTPEILAILEENDVKASFFVIGVNAEKHPELVAREAAAGHEVGLHTYTHLRLPEKNAAVIGDELRQEQTLLAPLVGGISPSLFRPPEGVCTEAVKEAATENGCTVVLWSVDTRDWTHRPAADIAAAVLREVRPGSIILMHDYISGGSPTPEALQILLPALRREGYTFCTVSELLNL